MSDENEEEIDLADRLKKMSENKVEVEDYINKKIIPHFVPLRNVDIGLRWITIELGVSEVSNDTINDIKESMDPHKLERIIFKPIEENSRECPECGSEIELDDGTTQLRFGIYNWCDTDYLQEDED